jgi:hypothetical protein
MALKLPTWEAAKEIAGKLPGDDNGTPEEVCEECGRPLEEDEDAKPGKKVGKF